MDGYDNLGELRERLKAQDPPNMEWRRDRQYPKPHLVDEETGQVPEPADVDQRWRTDRSGDVLWFLEGSGIDGYKDLGELAKRLRRQKPRNLEWVADHQYPLTLPFRVPRNPKQRAPGYWDGDNLRRSAEEMTPKQRYQHEARLERQRVFLAMLGQGFTTATSAEKAGVGVATIANWRRKYATFRNRMDRVRVGLAPDEQTEESFTTRRKYYFGFEAYTHHQKIIEAMEDTPPGGITMILLPPEAGKTTLLEDWCCDRIALDPNVRILYVSEAGTGQSPAAKVLGTVKERMVNPEREDPEAEDSHLPEWHGRYGPFRDAQLDRDKPWNKDYVKVHKASGRRDYTFQVASWRSSIYGARADWLIFDDVQSRKNINQTEEMLANIRTTFFSRPGRKGRTIFIGTRVGVGDIYERLIAEIPEHMVRLVQIPALDENGVSYCEEMWPVEALADKRAIVGEDSWATAYMMAPQMAEATTFTEELLDAARNPNLMYGLLNHSPRSLVLSGIDPALGGGNAVVVAETGPTYFNVVAVRVDYHVARNERILEILREMCRYGYHELVVERNSQQRGLARDERLRELAKEFGFKITEHETGTNKWDFNWGVGAMASSFIKREIGFPDATEKCRKAMEALRTELLAWRPDVPTRLLRQDMVMALWFTWMIWQQRKKRHGQGEQPPGWNVGATPWRPGDMSSRWKTGRRGLLVPS